MLPSISTATTNDETQYDDDDNDELDLCSDFVSGEEDDEDDFMIECDDDEDSDDVECYESYFLQQQRIRQERAHTWQVEDAKQRRQVIAQAILGGIHLTHSATKDDGSTEESSKNEPSKPVYSILRSPDGTEVLKVPLMDRSNGAAA